MRSSIASRVKILLLAAVAPALYHLLQRLAGELMGAVGGRFFWAQYAGSEADEAVSAAWREFIYPWINAVDIVTAVVFLLILWGGLRFFHRPTAATLGLRRINVHDFVPVALLGILCNTLTGFLVAVANFSEEAVAQHEQVMEVIGSGPPLLAALMSCVLAPIAEEVMARGFCYRILRRGFPMIVSAVLSGLVFGLAHGNPVQIFYATLMGVLFGYLYEKTANLWVPILLHMAYNSSNYLLSAMSDAGIHFWQYAWQPPVVLGAVIFCMRRVIRLHENETDARDALFPPRGVFVADDAGNGEL